MELELFVILALIILFLISCCGLLQKIRKNYEDENGRVISVAQITVPNQLYNNSAYQVGNDELYSGVYPSNLSPPPYSEHLEPPPRYEDLIKDNPHAIIHMVAPSVNATRPQVNPQTTELRTEPQRTDTTSLF